jgi:hypothetical protein
MGRNAGGVFLVLEEKSVSKSVATNEKIVLQDLGDGLVLRRALPADADALVDFNARVHSEAGPDQPDVFVGAWTRDLVARPHPTFHPGDFTLVEDTRTGQIVSSLNLISQTWTYDGIPFGVGRPELVGTSPEYRNRGLIRAQFEVVHAWSADRGELVQAITGIPYYYRLFGYEMAMNLGGGRTGYLPHIPQLEDGQEEPYHIRSAVESDLLFIAQTYEYGCQRGLVACHRDRELWRYELLGRSELSVNARQLMIIVKSTGEPVGFLAHPRQMWGAHMPLTLYELRSGVSWLDVTPTVLRYLERTGKPYVSRDGKGTMQGFTLAFGEAHPVYTVVHSKLPAIRQPYAYYLRVPDLPAFMQKIAPALERRLGESPAIGYSGELKLSFYRHGLRLVFQNGRVERVTGWQPTPQGHSGDALFPGLTFLQLLFGYRSLDELQYAYTDCVAHNDTVRALLTFLFPRLPSDVWPVS